MKLHMTSFSFGLQVTCWCLALNQLHPISFSRIAFCSLASTRRTSRSHLPKIVLLVLHSPPSLPPSPSPNMPPSPSFTQTLLLSNPTSYTSATQAAFLRSAGHGTLPASTLSLWLSQDRLYAQSYINFVGALLAKIRLPTAHTTSPAGGALEWDMLELLLAALANIRRELAFYDDVVAKYDLALEEPAVPGTEFEADDAAREYEVLFRSFAGEERSLMDGILVLWATERCYLDAWTYAKGFLDPSRLAGEDGDGGALRKEFIPNWTGEEFVEFVDWIAMVADGLAEREGVRAGDERYRELWGRVLDIEARFWPGGGIE